MIWMIYAMFAVTLAVLLFAVVIFVKRIGTDTNAERYDVFEISGNQLVVLTGIPVKYEIEEIAEVTFSAIKAPRSMSTYNGVMRVIKANGKKSRPFLFNSSAYTKRMVLSSSKQDIVLTIQYLMDEMRRYHIRCSRTM